MTASLLPADDTPGVPGADAGPRLPKYYQVKRQLLELTAALDPGSPVPPERELARSYGTSRTKVPEANKNPPETNRARSGRWSDCQFGITIGFMCGMPSVVKP